MNLPKALLPLLAAAPFFGGCVIEETTSYQEPRRAYHSGYVERDVVVERRRPAYYQEDRSRDYYRQRPVTVYEQHPRVYRDDRPRGYGGGYVVSPGHHGESYKERQEREIREAQRAQEDHHDKKKDGDKKKKKKKDHDGD